MNIVCYNVWYKYYVNGGEVYTSMATKKASTKKSAKKPVAAKASTKARVVKTATVKNVKSTKSGSFKDYLASAPLGALFAEFIGTFMLAAIVTSVSGQPIIVLFALTTIVLAIGHLSGAHVNPAITFGAWITRKVTTKRAVFYVLAQLLGAMFAFVLLSYLLNGAAAQTSPFGATAKPELFQAAELVKGKEIYAFVASLVGLSIFGFGVASALRDKKEHMAAAFTVGGSLFVALTIAGQYAILNPAVALTLQAFNVKQDALGWALAVHVLAPLVGSAIGFFLYDFLRRDIDQK